MAPRIWLKSITFSDKTQITLGKNDIIVIVGSNNSGKSASLRGIRDKIERPTNFNVVIDSLIIEKEGSVAELIQWLGSSATKINIDGTLVFRRLGSMVDDDSVDSIWQRLENCLAELAYFFCGLLTADARLTAANPPKSIALTTDAAEHPIHFLQRDDLLEKRLSQQFKKAFGLDLIVHRNAGSQVPIYVGEPPKIKSDQDRVSLEYLRELEKLPTIHTQGDGMRSFCGVLLYTAVGKQTVLLIDEPEAFLHPPHARLLGQMIVTDKQADHQIFVATHSGDVLRGILDSNNSNIRVIRLRRSENVNVARELDNTQINQLWGDPLLRYSNILDGLFHEKVVICESDSDCRFYAAVMDAIFEAKEDVRKPDIMFTHCGGKARLPLVIRALRQLEVPISVVADFDVLSEEQPLRHIIESAGGNWDAVAKNWKEVKSAIDGKKPELNTEEVKKDLASILDETKDPVFPSSARNRIQTILRRSSPWSTAKSVGAQYVPSGQPTQAYVQLSNHLQSLGIFIVPVGELEGFSKTVGAHGPGWVNEVIKKDLRNDPELDSARTFVSKISSM